MRFAHFEFDPKKNRLGEGPQSEVFRATDTRLGRTVALKILRPHVEFDPQATERFEREAKHTSNLSHQNIATVYEYGQDKGTSYIAMEFLEGRTLDKIVKDHVLGYDEGLRIALQVTSALALVHERGLIHRDLKPANIMVLGDGTVKLLDFGICRSTQESNITQDGMLVGTVLYMSPEQVLGEDLDVRADVFALGSVFYHAFTGQLPFPGKSFPEVCMSILEAAPRSPSELRSGFPAGLEEVLLRALSREPEARYVSGAAVHGALLSVADSLRVSTTAAPPASVSGKIVIPPLALRGSDTHAMEFAMGLRRDLYSELQRSTRLEVNLTSTGVVPLSWKDAYVLRGALELAGQRAALDYSVEIAHHNGKNGSEEGEDVPLFHDRIEHADADEWGLQAKLVSSLSRSLKRKLAEHATHPPTAERRDPERALALAKKAHEVLHRGSMRHLMAAISTFRRALDDDPGCAVAHAGMAESHVRKFLEWDGDRSFLGEARASARRALSLDPKCAEAHTSLGFAHMLVGDTTDAQREYRLAIQLDRDEWLAHRLLGALLGRLGNYEGASPLLQRATVLKPTHIGSYDHLYNVLVRLDRYQEGIEVADRGIAAARRHLADVPDDQEARLHLALILARMGMTDDARSEVAKARERFPKDAYTAFQAACVFALLGETARALELLQEAQERGYYLTSELYRNSDLEILRGRPEFQDLSS